MNVPFKAGHPTPSRNPYANVVKAVAAIENPSACTCIRFCTSSSRDSPRTNSQITNPAGSTGIAATKYFHETAELACTTVTDPTRTIRNARIANANWICALYVIHVDIGVNPCPEGGEGNASGVGASVRMNGEAARLYSGSIGASAGGDAGFCSLTARES